MSGESCVGRKRRLTRHPSLAELGRDVPKTGLGGSLVVPVRRSGQDLKYLQGILDEAKGQPGLARTRKMVTKMMKRIKAAQVGDGG